MLLLVKVRVDILDIRGYRRAERQAQILPLGREGNRMKVRSSVMSKSEDSYNTIRHSHDRLSQP
jgi:hypothetical protein